MREIERVLEGGENEKAEFKKSLAELKEIMQTAAAFANTCGGTILVGAKTDGEVVGFDGKGMEKLLDEIKNNIEPKLRPSINVENIVGKDVLSIRIPEGKSKPYMYGGRIYRRMASNTVQASRDDIEKIIVEEKLMWQKFDSGISSAKPADIDESKFRDFIETARRQRKMRLVHGDTIEALEKLGLAGDGALTNAAVLLFSNNPSRYFPYAVIKIAHKEGNRILDERLISGRLDEQIEEALDFIAKYLQKRIIKTGEAKRKEEWSIPLEAVREALVNAIAHRDYYVPSPITIVIEGKRLEITNPGELIKPLTPSKLKQKHNSILRNPLIANVLYLMNYIEGWGSGTNEILLYCSEAGIKDPDFIQDSGFFSVIFNEVPKEPGEERAFNEFLKGKKGITRKQYENLFNAKPRTARMKLSQLVEKGILRRIGKGKNTKYCPE